MSSASFGLPAHVRDHLLAHGVREHDALRALREATVAQLGERAVMISSPEQAALMQLLVGMLGATRAVEVGAFTGYNALAWALAMPAGGRVLCCDISREYTDFGRPYWQAAGVGERIEVRIGPAVETLDALLADGQADRFDIAFIDADKLGYPAYYERCVQLVRPGGLVCVDNVLWSGSVADPEDQRESTAAIREVSRIIRDDERVDIAMLPIGDGLTLARKRP